MDSRGFFGLLVLLVAMQALLAQSAWVDSHHAGYEGLEAELLAGEKTGFGRTQAEILIDRSVQAGLGQAARGTIDAQALKRAINANILEAAKAIGIDFSVCEEMLLGERAVKGIDAVALSSMSKAIAVKTGTLLVVEYSIAGGTSGNFFPCAQITNADHSASLRIPKGYIATMAVASP